jgi:nucleoside 2-deoxyribosyltransferase
MRPLSEGPRVYLAGPDVFFPDRAAIFARVLAQCESRGLVGLAPFDDAPAEGGPRDPDDDALAQRIYEGNVALIRSADGVIANLASFRGVEPDSGTVFEVGFAVALGKPVVAYGVPESAYADRVAGAIACVRDGRGALVEAASGIQVEGLGQRLNLMLSRSVRLAASAEAALDMLASVVQP